MTKKKTQTDDGAAKSLRERARARASSAFTGSPGSIIWLIRYAIELSHEFVIAINSLASARRAQKQIDEDVKEAEALINE